MSDTAITTSTERPVTDPQRAEATSTTRPAVPVVSCPTTRHLQHLLRILRGAKSGDAPLMVGLAHLPGSHGGPLLTMNIALTHIQTGMGPALIVNADPKNRSIEKQSRVSATVGLQDVIGENALPMEAVIETSWPQLSVVPAGQSNSALWTAPELSRCRDALATWQSNFSLVVVQLPPASADTQCFDLAALLDGIVLQVEAHRANQLAVARALRELQLCGAHVFGTVFLE